MHSSKVNCTGLEKSRTGLKIQKSPILSGYFPLNADPVFIGKISFLAAITVHIEGPPEEGRK
jgi:hypothetical protein